MKLFADHVAEKHVNTLMREFHAQTQRFSLSGKHIVGFLADKMFICLFCFVQLFSSKLMPCPFKCSHLQWPVW